MIKKITSFVLSVFALLYSTELQAQNSTNSPFSIFGIGEIEMRDFGRTTGMASVGIGLKSENYLNRRNPAGLSGLDTLRFVLDVSAAAKLSNFITASKNQHTNSFNFKNLAAGVRLTKFWSSSVGLSPYSNVGFNVKNTQLVEGSIDEFDDVFFSATGGVNKFYWANAFELFRGFSIGVTSSYFFGNIEHSEESSAFIDTRTSNISKIIFDFGLQYSHWFGEHTNITLGGIYMQKSSIEKQRKQVVTSNMAIELNKRLPDQKSYIPETYGAGFSITRCKKTAEWLFAADYQFGNWSADKSRYKSLTFNDSHLYSAGIQFTPNKKRPENYFQLIRFQLGASYNQSYLAINGFQLEDYSVSLGVGLPFNNSSYVNVAVNVGEAGTGKRGGITERYVLLSVSMSLIDRWYAKQLIH